VTPDALAIAAPATPVAVITAVPATPVVPATAAPEATHGLASAVPELPGGGDPLPAGVCGSATVSGIPSLSIRATPDRAGELVADVAAERQVELLCSAPVIADERTWREVRSGAAQGWMSTRYLTIDQHAPLGLPDQPADPTFAVEQVDGETLVTPSSGAIALASRFSPTHVLLVWRPDDGSGPALERAYLLNLETQTARPVQHHPTQGFFITESQIVVVEARTGAEHVIYDRDPAAEQWLPADLRPTETTNLHAAFQIAWATSTQLVLTINDLPDDPTVQRGLDFGKVVRIDITTGQVELLVESGSVFGLLADGTVLVRHGWIDGELWQHPISGPGALLTDAGVWVHGSIGLSPDRRWVVWREFSPPLEGDWSERLPHECCSGEPHPQPLGLVFWDRATGAVTHQPVPFSWSAELRYMSLTWSDDSQILFFHDDLSVSTRQYRLMQMRPGGTPTPLISYEGYHGQVDFVGPDGSLYYTINHGGGQFTDETYRMYPDGHSELLFTNTHSQIVYGVSFHEVDGLVTVTDHSAATSHQYQLPADQIEPPSYGWPYADVRYGPQSRLAYAGPALRIIPAP
jgi:hypothetical protein